MKDFLERNDPPWKMRVVMAMDIAVALNFMHKKGLVYRLVFSRPFWPWPFLHGSSLALPPITRRDIKPENLLLTENGHIKVCDLVGLS